MNCEYVAQVARVERLANGKSGVAVPLEMSMHFKPTVFALRSWSWKIFALVSPAKQPLQKNRKKTAVDTEPDFL
jgi:hypothetical protein